MKIKKVVNTSLVLEMTTPEELKQFSSFVDCEIKGDICQNCGEKIDVSNATKLIILEHPEKPAIIDYATPVLICNHCNKPSKLPSLMDYSYMPEVVKLVQTLRKKYILKKRGNK